MSQRVRIILSLMAATIALLAGSLTGAGTAQAADHATYPLTTSGGVGARSTAFTVTLVRTAAAKFATQEIITCSGTVTAPTQNGSTIRVDVQASCDAFVDTIEVGVGIGINGVLGPDDGKTVGPANFNSHFVTTPCPGATKQYTGVGLAVFTKAGYAGSPLTLAGRSPTVAIAC